MIPKFVYKYLLVGLVSAGVGAGVSGKIFYDKGHSTGYAAGEKAKEKEINGKIDLANLKADAKIKQAEEDIREIVKGLEDDKKQLAGKFDALSKRAKKLESQNKYLQAQLNSKGEISYVEKDMPIDVYTIGYVRLWNDAIRSTDSQPKDRLQVVAGAGDKVSDTRSEAAHPEIPIKDIVKFAHSGANRDDLDEFIRSRESGKSVKASLHDARVRADVGRMDFLRNHLHNQNVCQSYVVAFRRLVEAVKRAEKENASIPEYQELEKPPEGYVTPKERKKAQSKVSAS